MFTKVVAPFYVLSDPNFSQDDLTEVVAHDSQIKIYVAEAEQGEWMGRLEQEVPWVEQINQNDDDWRLESMVCLNTIWVRVL